MTDGSVRFDDALRTADFVLAEGTFTSACTATWRTNLERVGAPGAPAIPSPVGSGGA